MTLQTNYLFLMGLHLYDKLLRKWWMVAEPHQWKYAINQLLSLHYLLYKKMWVFWCNIPSEDWPLTKRSFSKKKEIIDTLIVWKQLTKNMRIILLNEKWRILSSNPTRQYSAFIYAWGSCHAPYSLHTFQYSHHSSYAMKMIQFHT